MSRLFSRWLPFLSCSRLETHLPSLSWRPSGPTNGGSCWLFLPPFIIDGAENGQGEEEEKEEGRACGYRTYAAAVSMMYLDQHGMAAGIPWSIFSVKTDAGFEAALVTADGSPSIWGGSGEPASVGSRR